MNEESGELPKRSCSQTSDTSSRSNKTKSRTRPRKSPSNASSIVSPKIDPSLTSFPSLSPDSLSNTNKNNSSSESPKPGKPARLSRTVSQRARDRKATLKGLTSASPPLTGRNALFDDVPRSSLDVPGALHLAHDDHIERLIARWGALKLVRQFAQDLAIRDAEISALRVRADERERELKKMLREVTVSSADIEKRLQRLESSDNTMEGNIGGARKQGAHSIDGMMHQAMSEDVGDIEGGTGGDDVVDLAATIRPMKPDNQAASRKSTGDSTRNSGTSAKGWQGYIWGSTTNNSRKTSTSSSMISQEAENADATARPRQPSSNTTRRKGLNNLFQPQSSPSGSSYFLGGAGAKVKPSSKGSTGDDSSVHSKQSTRSMTSWTMKLFAGNSQAGNEAADSAGARGRSSSLGQANTSVRKTPITATESALAALAKTTSHTGATSASSSSTFAKPPGTLRSTSQGVRRLPNSANGTLDSPEHARPSSNQEDFGPVEMDAILPLESKPPTMAQTYNKYQAEGLLTDRFGFIYDQRQRKRRRDTTSSITRGNQLCSLESLGNYRHDSDIEDGASLPAAGGKTSGLISPTNRPMTPASIDEQADSAAPKKWHDYLKISKLTRPTELLLHTPSAGAIVTVNTADATGTITPPLARATSISVSARKVLPTASSPAGPNLSLATASVPEPSGNEAESRLSAPSGSTSPEGTPTTEQEPVKLLVDRLTELHDSLQAQKETRWNEFLRKVRAERSFSTAADQPAKVGNAPEAEIVDGEVIGISTLGRPNKNNRNKYIQFKALVLQGIPVSLRPKVWSECSGANALRSPGYYDDLVSRSESGEDVDREIASQIKADIGRTLTDNTFFRHGPGVSRLETILLAYSIHNPSVGYCQGMNLITGSLLLIMPTPEDAFWILVAIIENILPSGYFEKGLLVSRADQIVLRSYVSEVLPKLGAQFEDLGVELEACSFMWFLSLFTGCLSAEALYRVWDVVLCLNSSDTPPGEAVHVAERSKSLLKSSLGPKSQPGTSSPFLFQLCLALLKLNEPQLLALDSAAAVYSYVNHNMTNHAISIDGLISASEALRKVVKREDVLARRAKAVEQIGGSA